MVRRSLLFTPGDRPEMLRKAPDSGADVIVFDLEDAVSPGRKDEAREAVREVLETAHEMGYFEYPKRANAGDVAEAVGISRSTFSEHLGAAQTKLLDAILEA